MSIQVSDSFNQLKIERGSKVEYYKYATIKSISPVSDSNNDFAVVINFITDDKDNPLVLKMKDITNQATWLNTGIGVNAAIEAISDWMHTDNPSTNVTVEGWTAPLGQKPMATSIPVVIASDQTNVGVDINEPLGVRDSIQAVSVVIARDQAGARKDPTFLRVDSNDIDPTGTISSACSISIANTGTAFGLIGTSAASTVQLKEGETISFDAGAVNATLSGIYYSATNPGAEFLIIYTSIP